jgi:hypothetical protein
MNDQQRAVVQQALEALEDATQTTAYDHGCEYHYHTCCGAMFGNAHMSDCKQSKAITALRQLLEQSVQEPLGYWLIGTDHVEFEKHGYHNGPEWEAIYTTPPIVATPLAQQDSKN